MSIQNSESSDLISVPETNNNRDEIKLEDRGSQSLALLSTLCSPCIWCTNLYSRIKTDGSQTESLWLKKEKPRPQYFPNNSSYPHRGRGDSGDSSSAAESRASRACFTAEADLNYQGHPKRAKTLRHRLDKKLTYLRNGNLFRSVREDTDLLKSPEGSFRIHKIFGDGNCMYRSLSYIIWGDEDEHRSLRTMVVEHIKDNWWDYSAFVMAEWNISDRQEYYDFMIANGTYATEFECMVAAKLYRMNLSIYREIYDTGNLERIFHNRINRNYRTARLLFSGRTESGHYDVLVPD